MNNLEKYEHWEDLAIYDLETSRVMLSSGRYTYVAFTCQQAIEKIVKALYVLYLNEEAPKTHNILYVFELIFNKQEIRKSILDETFEDKLKKYMPLLVRLHSYYISERYKSYKDKVNQGLDKTICGKLLEETEECFKWLQYLKIFYEN